MRLRTTRACLLAVVLTVVPGADVVVRDSATLVGVNWTNSVVLASEGATVLGQFSGQQADPAGAPLASVVYSSTSGTLPYTPGSGVYIADDLRTTIACDCNMTAYTIGVDGGGDGTGTFGVQVAMLDDCPDDGGQVIAGTEQTFLDVNDGGLTVLTVDLSSAPIPIQRTVWLRVRFTSSSAGVIVGAPADVGFSVDGYWHPNGTCMSTFGGAIYAAFYAEVYCDAADPPPVPTNPNPGDLATGVRLNADLSWSGGALRSEPQASEPAPGKDYAALRETLDDSDWVRTLRPGGWCTTQERYEMKLAAAGGAPGRAPAGGCPLDGTCDLPEVRDAFTPDPETLVKEIRTILHIFCLDDGTACLANQNVVDAQMAVVNQEFDPYRVQFIHETEFINNSTYRDLLPDSEAASMKTLYADSPDTKLNIYLVNNVDPGGAYSWGTFPWDSDALGVQGGVVMHVTQFGATDKTLVHEIGHNLGLWHTHHGVDEVSLCGSCYEWAGVAGQDNEGDRCSDTPPTPTNFNCSPPGGSDSCNAAPWGTTDYPNYMGYAPSYCIDHFSTQQSGRIHCWTEDVLASWLEAQCVTEYDVYMDTTDPPTTLVCEKVADPFCEPGVLECDATLYWQVVATRAGVQAPGSVWSFTTVGGGDCNTNGTPDLCEIDLGMAPDCNGNDLPDDCDPDGDGDGVPDDCDPCPLDNPDDSDGDGVCDSDDICPGGDDTVDTDGDGVPDYCDPCPIDNPDDADGDGVCTSEDNCELPNPDQTDCQPNDIGDVCDVAPGGGSLDGNENGIPDECEALPPLPEPGGPSCSVDSDCTGHEWGGATCVAGTCYVPKNRYLSIDPTANANPVAYRVTVAEASKKVCSISLFEQCDVDGDCPQGETCEYKYDQSVVGATWWLEEPVCKDNNGQICPADSAGPHPAPCTVPGEVPISNCSAVDLDDMEWMFGWYSGLGVKNGPPPPARVWTEYPVHIGDCVIAPVITYQVEASATDGVSFGAPLEIMTIRQSDKDWGDVTGGSDAGGVWAPPNLTTGMTDLQGVVKAFEQPSSGFVPYCWADMDGTQSVSMTDIQWSIKAFEQSPGAELWTLMPIGPPSECP